MQYKCSWLLGDNIEVTVMYHNHLGVLWRVSDTLSKNKILFRHGIFRLINYVLKFLHRRKLNLKSQDYDRFYQISLSFFVH